MSFLAACGGTDLHNASCTSANDCATGYLCQAGECVAPGQCASTQLSCTKDAQCPTGNSCQAGCCTPLAAGACASNTDCTDATKPHCDTGTHACVACSTNNDCAAGKICSGRGTCEKGCAADSDCPGAHCFHGTNGNFCGECANDTQCTNINAPLCRNGTCFGCSSDADCSGTTPACDGTTHKCVACVDAQNGATGTNPRCTGSAKACVNDVCVTCAPSKNNGVTGVNGACPTSAPVCDSNSTCVACLDQYNGGTGSGPNGACTSASAKVCINKTCSACLTTGNDAASGINAGCQAESAATPVCAPSNAGCIACDTQYNSAATGHVGENAACPAGTAVCKQNACIACLTANNDATTGVNASCTADATKQVCDANDSGCVQCTQDSHCASPDVCSNKVCTLPVLADLLPNTASPFVGSAYTLTIQMSNAVRVATDVNVTLAGEGSLDSASTLTSEVVTVQPGSATATFSYYAPGAVPAGNPVVTATLAGVSKTSTLTVTNAPLSLSSLSCASPSVIAFGKVTCTVFMNHAAASDAAVGLTTSTAEGSVPASVTVAGGTESAQFDFTAGPNATTTAVTITATYAGDNSQKTADVSIRALQLAAFAANLTTNVTTPLTVNVAFANGESTPVDQTITLNADVGSVPASMTITAGNSTGSFSFTPPHTNGTAHVTASFNGGSQIAAIAVTGQPVVSSFSPGSGTFVRVGEGEESAFPTKLNVSLAAPAPFDFDVTVTGDANVTIANSGTLHFAAGDTTHEVTLTGVTQAASVTLTAAAPNDTGKTATIRVLGATEQPTTLSLTPTATSMSPNGTQQFTLATDIPVPSGYSVSMDYGTGAANFVSPPASVAIPVDTKTTTFTLTAAASVSGQTNITGTDGTNTTPAATVTFAAQCPSGTGQLVISQVYGGGGFTTPPALYKYDFVELHNRGATPISLNGFAIQYASSSNTTVVGSTIQNLANVTIPAGGYYLVRLSGSGTALGTDIPDPDESGTINMSSSNGKVYLTNTTTAISLAGPPAGAPADMTKVLDAVGYGTANWGEGATEAPALSGSNSDVRGPNGCADTNVNNVDWVTSAAGTYRNSHSTPQICQVCGGTAQ